MSDFLQSMAASSAERAASVSGRFSSADFDKPLVPLTLGAFDVIAEIKERSPAEGALKSTTHDRVGQAQRYAEGGALAISVLTEPSRFDGHLDHLEEIAAALPKTPVMRKDFLVDPVQVHEARQAGASGVLLIATMLSDARLREMLDAAWQHYVDFHLNRVECPFCRANLHDLQNEADRKTVADATSRIMHSTIGFFRPT